MLNEKLDLVMRYVVISSISYSSLFVNLRERDLARKQVQELKHRTFQGDQFDDLK